ncbi:MAG TPA: hypothetical protein VE010_01800 [Thermoanaerobaculia bacterium]|nr:hypothetical protein [Thermoanaerobaculia bacterium]
MREGWLDQQYLILFDEEETHRVTAAYGVSARLPEFLVVGLRGWDDFILQDRSGSLFTVPAVPLDHKHLKPYVLSRDAAELQTDSRRCGLIKWCVQPLVFGGDPLDQSNITWLSHETHVRAVRWWNDLYERVQNPR